MRMDVRQRVAAELRAEMGRQQRSQSELATAAGVSQSTVSRWINGRQDMTVTEFAAVCAFLGVKAIDLLGETDSDSNRVGAA